jgi:hypothetical protein
MRLATDGNTGTSRSAHGVSWRTGLSIILIFLLSLIGRNSRNYGGAGEIGGFFPGKTPAPNR